MDMFNFQPLKREVPINLYIIVCVSPQLDFHSEVICEYSLDKAIELVIAKLRLKSTLNWKVIHFNSFSFTECMLKFNKYDIQEYMVNLLGSKDPNAIEKTSIMTLIMNSGREEFEKHKSTLNEFEIKYIEEFFRKSDAVKKLSTTKTKFENKENNLSEK
jgi:hypothetical protein